MGYQTKMKRLREELAAAEAGRSKARTPATRKSWSQRAARIKNEMDRLTKLYTSPYRDGETIFLPETWKGGSP